MVIIIFEGLLELIIGRKKPTAERKYVAFLDLNGPIFEGCDTTYNYCMFLSENDYNGKKLLLPKDKEMLLYINDSLETDKMPYSKAIPQFLDIYEKNTSAIPLALSDELMEEFVKTGEISLQTHPFDSVNFLDSLIKSGIVPIPLTSTPYPIINIANKELLDNRLQYPITTTQATETKDYDPAFHDKYGKRGKVYGRLKRRVDSLREKNLACKNFITSNKGNFNWIEYKVGNEKILLAGLGAGDRINDMGFLDPYCFVKCVLNHDQEMYKAAKQAQQRDTGNQYKIWIIYPDSDTFNTELTNAFTKLHGQNGQNAKPHEHTNDFINENRTHGIKKEM
ncbi:MAG: hypothetical protein V1870_03715 [Candidatus Aenigmatarchaeota archaeon]